MAYFIAFLVIIGLIYSFIRDTLIKVTGDVKKTDKVIDFLFNLLGVLISGYIVFWLVYSAFVTWG